MLRTIFHGPKDVRAIEVRLYFDLEDWIQLTVFPPVSIRETTFYGFLFITKTRLFKYTENFTTKNESFQIKKKSDIFLISAQNIDCGYSSEPPRRGGSDEQSMFLSRNKKNNVYPCKPEFYYIKVRFKGVKII